MVARGGWGGDAEAGPGEEGRMGCIEVRLEHEGSARPRPLLLAGKPRHQGF